MAHPTLELRQAVFQAIAYAKSAAALHSTMSQYSASDPTLKEHIKHATYAAYSASNQAWVAMIALTSRNADAAISAARAAYEAQTALKHLSPQYVVDAADCDFTAEMALPDEAALLEMWNDFCGTYAVLFSQSEPCDDPIADSISRTGRSRPAQM